MANNKRMDCVILGMLHHGNLTGYEIKKQLDGPFHFFWGGSYGSIYPTLAKLCEESYIEKEEKDQAEKNKVGREKIRYRITEKGRKFLAEWLKVPTLKNELRYESLLKIYFGNSVGEEATIAHINAFEKKVKEELKVLYFYKENLEKVQEVEAHKYFLAVAMFGIETYEGYLRWCGNARKLLE